MNFFCNVCNLLLKDKLLETAGYVALSFVFFKC